MEKLYYISQGATLEAHYQHIKKVCENGVKLVQLRVKNANKEELLQLAEKCKTCCEYYGATLLINDHVWLAKVLGLGVHLGKNDQAIAQAKQALEKKVLVGGTANTLEDCLHLIAQGVDYIGLGPFKFTQTKKNLSPILGIQAYEHIITSLKETGQYIPIYAIGGISTADFESLFDTGVHGIAVSGLLSKASAPIIQQIVQKL